LLIEELKKQGIDEGGVPQVKKETKTAIEPVKDSISLRKEIVKKKKNFRSMVLEETFDTGLPDG
jgi:hypothetical protein